MALCNFAQNLQPLPSPTGVIKVQWLVKGDIWACLPTVFTDRHIKGLKTRASNQGQPKTHYPRTSVRRFSLTHTVIGLFVGADKANQPARKVAQAVKNNIYHFNWCSKNSNLINRWLLITTDVGNFVITFFAFYGRLHVYSSHDLSDLTSCLHRHCSSGKLLATFLLTAWNPIAIGSLYLWDLTNNLQKS